MICLHDYPQVTIKGAKSFNLTKEAEKVQQWKTIDRARSRWVNGITPVVQSAFRAEQTRVKRAITSMLTPHSTLDSVDEEIRSDLKPWQDLLKNIYVPVGRGIASNVINDLDKSLKPYEEKAMTPLQESMVDPLMLDYLDRVGAEKVRNITRSTMLKIQTELKKGIEEGEGIDQLSKRIDALYLEQIIPNRSILIARTEVIQASNAGSLAGAKATGLPGLKKVWLATRDSRTRESHTLEDGTIVEIDGHFTLSSGSRLEFPGDTSLGASAADTIQCRCTQFYEGE